MQNCNSAGTGFLTSFIAAGILAEEQKTCTATQWCGATEFQPKEKRD
jgi:hypothetical protein